MPQFQYAPPSANPHALSVADILMRSGDIRARSAEQVGAIEAHARAAGGEAAARAAAASGDIWGRAIGQIGDTVAAIPGQIQQQKRQGIQDAHIAAQTNELKSQADARAAGIAKQQRLDAQNKYIDDIMKTSMKDDPETGVSTFDRAVFEKGLIGSGLGHLYPDLAETMDKLDASAAKRNTESRAMLSDALVGVAKAGYTPQAALSAAAYLKKNRVVGDEQLQPILEALADDSTPEGVKRVVDGLGQNQKGYQDWASNEEKRKADLAKTVADTAKTTADTEKVRAEVAGTLAKTPQQVETERHNREQERIATLTAGRGDAAAAETARHNRAMEESARNRVTARPVLSGDANRLAEIDTSIEQLHGLKGLKTGVGSQLAADWVPNFVTEWTGVGAESKGRQALIDTVKQIIGKGLEGGVLRKEDEIKYAKILPRIGDPPDVAAEKIKGLDTALTTKKEQTLEALEDAGFNVSNFRARATKTPPANADPLGIR